MLGRVENESYSDMGRVRGRGSEGVESGREVRVRGGNESGGDLWQREASQVCLLLEKER